MLIPTDGTFYGREDFNPLRIITQIIALQTAFYFSFLICLLFMDFISGVPENILEQMFSQKYLTFSHFPGCITVVSFVLACLLHTTIALVFLIGRSKKVWDFVATLFVFHWILCCSYSKEIPSHVSWWVINVAMIIFTTLLAEYICMQNEMMEIPVTSILGTKDNSKLQASVDIETGDHDE